MAFPEQHTHQPPTSTQAQAEAPGAAVMRMAGGFAMTQVLHTAVVLGIPEQIGDGPCAAGKLAADMGLNRDALERLLRMMAVLGLLDQCEDTSHFRLTEAGQLLRGGHPRSLRGRILYIGAINYPAAAGAPHALRTGAPAFDHVFGAPFFDHLSRHPPLEQAFQGLMQEAAKARTTGILGAHDFSAARHVVDLGGGDGTLLAAILMQASGARGTLLDAPAVVAQARSRLAGTAVASRIDFVAGDLFAGAYPAGADVYLLSNIIHDWPDTEAETILRHCAAALPPGGTLLLVEEILPVRVSDAPSTVANDYSMLLLTGGRERNEAEYRALLGRSGLALHEVIPFATAGNQRPRKGNWALLRCHGRP